MFEPDAAYSSFSVDDLEAAKTFYEDTLRMNVAETEMGFLNLHLPGGAIVMVYTKDDHSPASYTVLNLVVADIAQAVDDLAASGIMMQRYDQFEQDEKGISREMGPAIAWFSDPAGNTIAVLENSEIGNREDTESAQATG